MDHSLKNFIHTSDNNNSNALIFHNTRKEKDSTARITDFPKEILLKIFEYLAFLDLQKNVSLVSHQWHDLIKENTLGLNHWCELIKMLMPQSVDSFCKHKKCEQSFGLSAKRDRLRLPTNFSNKIDIIKIERYCEMIALAKLPPKILTKAGIQIYIKNPALTHRQKQMVREAGEFINTNVLKIHQKESRGNFTRVLQKSKSE